MKKNLSILIYFYPNVNIYWVIISLKWKYLSINLFNQLKFDLTIISFAECKELLYIFSWYEHNKYLPKHSTFDCSKNNRAFVISWKFQK
jgi:hypothetical protein